MGKEEIKKILEKQLQLLSERSVLIAIADTEGQKQITEAMIMIARVLTTLTFYQDE